MNYVLVSVEGQTEETFVQDVLRKHLWNYNVDLSPVVISTSRAKRGTKNKGGLRDYFKARREIEILLRNTNAVAVTTLYDLYGLPTNFPGLNTFPAGGSGTSKAKHLEKAFQDDIGSSRFYPHLQVHEFESFLFVEPSRTAALFPENDLTKEIQKIREKFHTPEDINDNPHTAPSKRILELYPNYDKPLYGTLAVLEVGLDLIRAECPHFNSWLTWLEGLG
ncbi:MAG TPA: hypothetical protein DHW49_00595 [Anaerolineae bacterium]|nr:hypothetical protein [Anaerolineae bacterium]